MTAIMAHVTDLTPGSECNPTAEPPPKVQNALNTDFNPLGPTGFSRLALQSVRALVSFEAPMLAACAPAL
jgi:hypothetical protein